ncbi:hypothetical protein CYMTET_7089 [Cymbomonas tetramitiformis]|uniref:Uncharacterized protein n=1 Tax=Cymbomonas tetramitiformis TaxID=36881 RepID=A0AAE0GVW5_9CHLO|nr:hypothetical protein CYMTET_7089 [Cymbomonas tetramitiformis]
MNTPSPPSSEAEPILSVEVDNPGTPEKEPKLKEPMTPTPNASRLQLEKEELRDQVLDPLTVAQKEMKTVTIPLNLLGDLLLDLLSTHRVDLVDLIEAGPHGVDLFYKALTLLGVPLTAYISAGGSVSGSPALLLSSPAVTTYALMVNKHVVDAVLYDYHHSPGGRGVAPPVWMDITEWPLEEQSSMLDRDCLAAWFEVQRSQWERRRGRIQLISTRQCEEIRHLKVILIILEDRIYRRLTIITNHAYLHTLRSLILIEFLLLNRSPMAKQPTVVAIRARTSELWQRRFSDPDIFLGDLAKSTLPVIQLVTLRDDLQIAQKREETADVYHSRLTNRYNTINFLVHVY